MLTPPLLLFVTLAFWGWQTEYWVIGLILGGILEASRLVKTRWEFTLLEFNQLWNITTVMFVAAAVFAFAMNDGGSAMTGFFGANNFTERSTAMNKAAQAMLEFIKWLPMIFFVFVAAQAYSSTPRIDFRVFSWFVRRKAAATPQSFQPGRGVNSAYPYFAICLLSASVVNPTNYLFYASFCSLLIWGMWPVRSVRFRPVTWVALCLLAAGLGVAAIQGLMGLNYLFNNFHTSWVSGFGKKGFDPKESRTAMGEIGRLKGSGSVVLRLEVPEGDRVPYLLRQAIYTYYQPPYWRGNSRTFGAATSETNDTTWVLSREPFSNTVSIAMYLDRGKGVLALPAGTRRMDRLPVYPLETNHLGTARVDTGPGLVIFLARYGPGPTYEGAPDSTDLEVPTKEQAAVLRVIADNHLDTGDRAQKLRNIQGYFSRYFEYSLVQSAGVSTNAQASVLSDFLLKSRRGHCEFFASATVLLLRQMGVPARYCAGYSVQEGSGGNRFVVRDRHAHAWSLYYDDQARAWVDFDTTPGNWVDADRNQRSIFEPIQDLFARLWFEFSKIRHGQSILRNYLSLALVPVVLYLLIRFIFAKRWKKTRTTTQESAIDQVCYGLDSEFYQLEKKLLARGLTRYPGETLQTWLERVRRQLPSETPIQDSLVLLHYRLRFDPAGVTADEREVLKTGVNNAIHHLEQSRTSSLNCR